MLRSHLDRLESNLTSKHKLSYFVTKKSLKKNPTKFDCCEETNCMKSLFWQAFYANSILFCDDQILFKVENKCETKINSYKEHLKVSLTSSHQITCWKRLFGRWAGPAHSQSGTASNPKDDRAWDESSVQFQCG